MSRSHPSAGNRRQHPTDHCDTIGAGPKRLSDNQLTEARPAAVELKTIAEAASFLRVSMPTVRRLQQARRIPFIKVGGSVRFARSDLLAYIEKQRVRSVDEYNL